MERGRTADGQSTRFSSVQPGGVDRVWTAVLFVNQIALTLKILTSWLVGGFPLGGGADDNSAADPDRIVFSLLFFREALDKSIQWRLDYSAYG